MKLPPLNDERLYSDLKTLILERIPQEEIFEHYLEIPVTLDSRFCSPLRKDKNPNCEFIWTNGRLRLWDRALGKNMDCFDVVMQKTSLGYREVLDTIYTDLGGMDRSPIPRIEEHYHQRLQKAKIQVETQAYPAEQIAYLTSFGITGEIVDTYKCFSARRIWINGNLTYTWNPNNPALAYWLGDDEQGNQKWKIYFIFRRSGYRFLSNTNRINGLIQLPETGTHLVLTKSMKDVMVFARLGVNAIAMQSETTIPYAYLVADWKARFKAVYTLYDFDYTGVRYARMIRNLYSIPPLFLTDGRFSTPNYKAKDISDYVKAHGFEHTEGWVGKLLGSINSTDEDPPWET